VNNQRSSSQQFFLFLALAWGAMLIYQNFFGAKKSEIPPRPLPKNALVAAFSGIDPAQPPVLDKTKAASEILDLDKQIKANETDGLSYWARLRSGLIQQYVLKDTKAALTRYDEIAAANKSDAVGAQAAYQKGDLLWVQSSTGGKPSQEAAKALETLVHRGRSSTEFLDQKIFVPAQAGAEVTALPLAWEQKAIRELHGTLDDTDTRGILERVDAYYSTTLFHKIFAGAAKAFGNNPAYSYGLAILAFALVTRVVLQPLNKKQYDSMRGMAVIAPEMKKVQDKYKNKKDQESQMRMMNEIRALQKSHGVNPMLGCGLAAVQIPVFIFVVSPFIQHFEARLELVNASFLWINNLARPDIPLLVLYALSQFASMRLASTPPADDQQRQMQLMMLFFPFAVPFFLLAWPSAFTMYWMAFNILSMFFQYRMMKAADPTKRLWTQLVTQPLIPQIVVADPSAVPAGAIPPRPKKGRAESVKTIAADYPANGNGKSNGRIIEAKSAFSTQQEPANGDSNGNSSNGKATGGIRTSDVRSNVRGAVRTKRRGKKK
jgi:YidC/Oxa1 family membrane protein insertase